MTTGGITTGSAVGGERRDERRATPRSRVAFPIELSLPIEASQSSVSLPGTSPDARAAAQVCDLSLSGICCLTTRPIGVMTQVGLLLVLPEADTAIDCHGAVVRSRKIGNRTSGGEPDEASGEEQGPLYETAIFFTSMAEPDRIELQEFLQTAREHAADDAL